MKKFSKIAVIVLMLVAVVCAVAACRSVDGISVDGTDAPRTTYVQGQDLDLSKGKILVKTNNGTEEVALNAKGVSVTGYDKSKLGDQELTVKYEGKTASFSVKVIARIALDRNCVTEYFVGEYFDKSKGRIIVANDDGTTKSVDMSSDGVEITGFDSSAPGNGRAATVSYGGYTDTFNVNVYAIESSKLTAPRKKEYKSHETDIDLTGGFIMLKSGDVTKNVTITRDMISGFAPDAADENNSTTPLSQKISVAYAGFKGSFNINVIYTDVSRIHKIALSLADIDWSGETYPAIADDKGEAAISAAEMYLGLGSAERAYISDEDKNAVIKTAVVYGRKIWREDAAGYSDAFTVNEQGEVTFVCNTLSDAVAGADKLGSSPCTLITNSELLTDIASEFGDIVLVGEEKISAYLDSVCTPSELTVVLASLDYMSELDSKVSDGNITDWTKENYATYADEIAALLAVIDGGDFKSSRDRAIYEIVFTKWRNGDFIAIFDAMYAYCYHGEHLSDAGAILNIYLPAKVQALYNYTLLSYMEVLKSATASGRAAYETTLFMLYYDNATKALEDVSANGDDVDKWLSVILSINVSSSQSPVSLLNVLALCRTSQYGYIYHHNAWFEDAEFTGLWTQYLEVCRDYAQYISDNKENDNAPAYWTVEENGNKIKAMFETFVNMSSPRQMGFLRSLNVSYMNRLPAYALYYGETVYSEFVYLVANYYEDALPEKSLPVFRNLLLAIESYSRTFALSDAGKSFTDQMDAASKAYAELDPADKTGFDALLKTVYDKYAALPEKIQAAASYELGDNKAKFDALKEAITNINLAAVNIANKRPVYNMLFAAYEQAESLVKEILESGNEDLINAYYNLGYYDYTTQSGTVKWSLEYAMYNMRGIYVTYLTNTALTQNSGLMWYTYKDNGMGAFYEKAAHVMWTYNNNLGTGEKKEYDKAAVLASMAAFRDLTDMGKVAVNILSQNSNYYYNGLDAYFKSVLLPDKEGELDPEDYAVYEVASRLMAAERLYVAYLPYKMAEGNENNPDGFEAEAAEAKKEFTDAMDDVERLYGALSSEEQALFDSYLKDAYDHYKAVSDGLKAATGGAAAVAETAAA